MLKNIFTLAFITMASIGFAQEVEDEVGFIYVKAEYMLETGRYSDAIKQYTEVIRLDPDYKDALIKRAMAKYEMRSYRGVRDDLLKGIKSSGATPEAIRLLGLTDYKLGNHNAAVNTLGTAAKLFPSDGEIYYARGESYLALDMFEDACAEWAAGAKKGNNSSRLQQNKYCNGVVTRPRDTGSSTSTPSPGRDTPGERTGKVDKPGPFKPKPGTDRDVPQQEEEYVEEEYVEEETGPPVDDSVNKIEVDETLLLEVRNGLGSREIIQQPNILILSDSKGDVVVDVCVNERGRVDSAEFNEGESTLDSRSIVSLAVRKAQEFWFEKSEWDEMCGTIIFHIGER